MNDLQYRARHTVMWDAGRRLMAEWLEGHRLREVPLEGQEDSEKPRPRAGPTSATSVDWVARRCGGEIDNDRSATVPARRRTCWKWRRPSRCIHSPAERSDDQNLVTLTTLHAAKGLEWPHVVMVGVNEACCPSRTTTKGDDAAAPGRRAPPDVRGHHRARLSLAVSTSSGARRASYVAGIPSRFIPEMRLNEKTAKEDPGEKLKALQAEFAARAAARQGSGPMPEPFAGADGAGRRDPRADAGLQAPTASWARAGGGCPPDLACRDVTFAQHFVA